ncbi:YcaO-like family protein [Helicobacter pylori]|uniref:YcaO-like family protein n=1 Tax=Helicobacter pylori TaxID=210 RepID=UPI00217ECC6B|nr:YcaO-like family protein [Helicobacter pylori]
MLKICELLDLLLDFECGLITYITEIPTQHLEPLIQIYVAEFQNPCSLTSNDRVMPITNRQVSGAGLTKEEALLATIGEALERYSISQSAHINSISNDRVMPITNRQVSGAGLTKEEADYKKKTAPFKKPNLNNPIHFVAAKNLSTGQEHFVPRSLVFMDDEGCNRFDKTYSTGTACHIDREKAIFSSLCELIERDVYACYWLCGITPLCLNNCFVLSQLPNEFSEEILRTGLNIKTFALMNQFEIPVIACTITVCLNNCFVLSQLPNEFSEEILRTGLNIKTFALMNQFEIPVIACTITGISNWFIKANVLIFNPVLKISSENSFGS